MTKVEALEEEIKKLSPREMAQLRDWMSERDWEEWTNRSNAIVNRENSMSCLRKRSQTTRLARATNFESLRSDPSQDPNQDIDIRINHLEIRTRWLRSGSTHLKVTTDGVNIRTATCR